MNHKEKIEALKSDYTCVGTIEKFFKLIENGPSSAKDYQWNDLPHDTIAAT